MKTKKVWKKYPLDFEFKGNYTIEFSNEGDVRTYNKHQPEGKIINGSLQGGFKIIRTKLFKERSEKDQQKIDDLVNKISELNKRIKELGNGVELAEEKAKLKEERDQLMAKKTKRLRSINKKNTIYFAILVSRAVAELFLDPPTEDQKFIIHKDFDKLNNHVDNLAWATQEDLNARVDKHPKNILHQFRKQFEERVPNTKMGKLTEKEVLIIKTRLKKGYTLRRLAKQFHVSDMQIHRIKTGENWSHVKLIEDIKNENKE